MRELSWHNPIRLSSDTYDTLLLMDEKVAIIVSDNQAQCYEAIKDARL
jgi:hypothetical protein